LTVPGGKLWAIGPGSREWPGGVRHRYVGAGRDRGRGDRDGDADALGRRGRGSPPWLRSPGRGTGVATTKGREVGRERRGPLSVTPAGGAAAPPGGERETVVGVRIRGILGNPAPVTERTGRGLASRAAIDLISTSSQTGETDTSWWPISTGTSPRHQPLAGVRGHRQRRVNRPERAG
jgi:hypothetical protein